MSTPLTHSSSYVPHHADLTDSAAKRHSLATLAHLEIGLDRESPQVAEILEDFSRIVERSLSTLTSEESAREGAKPRAELRFIAKEEYPNTLANIALAFNTPQARDRAFAFFQEKYGASFSIVSAGTTTIEIGNLGVNKGTVIHFMANHFGAVLTQSAYRRGPLIDARLHGTFLCVDGDGTVWDKPSSGKSPLDNHLGNSAARPSLLAYLRAGGVLVINSGNDPERTRLRFLMGIQHCPDVLEEEIPELLSRVVIAASGGHSLVTLDSTGSPNIVRAYLQEGLSEQKQPLSSVDCCYLGDDANVHGNDYPAYQAVGEQRFAIVAKEGTHSVTGFSSHVLVIGETRATQELIAEALKALSFHPDKPVFSDVPSLRSVVHAKPQADHVIHETLRVLGRAGVDDCIAHCEEIFNGPVRYEQPQIDRLIQIFYQIREKHAQGPYVLNYRGLLDLSDEIKSALGSDFSTYQLLHNLTGSSWQELLNTSLDQMHLQSGDIVRILEPGNNDQATPLFIAEQVSSILEYARIHDLALRVQVLVMGQGGHATTASFPQFAHVQGSHFSGTPEADSLSTVLAAALKQKKIDVTFVEDFSDVTEAVQIQRARFSKNTGENVREAIEADRKDVKKVRHLFVTSAIAGSTRQALTFAQQYSANPQEPGAPKLYSSLTAIPLPRTRRFIAQAWTDFQAVTELYAGLAERARFYAYAFNLKGPYIPAGPIDESDLEHLYLMYDLLSETRHLETSKSVPITDILKFFQERFTLLETAITWNKDPESQLSGTHAAILAMQQRYREHALVSNLKNP